MSIKILVIGGAGFIGSNLVTALQRKGYDIVVIDNLLSGKLNNLVGFSGEFIEADISTLDLFLRFKNKRFDIIFHQAAITDTTFSNEEEMIRANVDGFKNILKFAKSINARLIYASSAGVYGRGKIPMHEDQQLSPLNAYSVSKKMIDDITKEEIEKNTTNSIKVVGLRYFNVYGPKEKYKGRSASMIYQLYLQMKQSKRPRIFKWGEQFRDFIYVKDVITANLKAMECEKSCIVNIATGKPTTFNRIIEILNQVLNTNYEPEYFDNPYGFYQNETLASTELAFILLNFKAKYSIDDGIKDYLSYL